jgi:hypothetical protein
MKKDAYFLNELVSPANKKRVAINERIHSKIASESP